MSGLDDLLRSLPIDQFARALGVDEATASQAASTTLPALLGGLKANAADATGASSLAEAVQKHSGSIFDKGIDFSKVDTADGQKISEHIFGENQGQVTAALGEAGPGADLIKKALPMLAPLVLSFLNKQMQSGGAAAGLQAEGGAPSFDASGIQDLLGQVLGGAQGGQGGGIMDMLGGLLGGAQGGQR